jgi:hypothetical protein
LTVECRRCEHLPEASRAAVADYAALLGGLMQGRIQSLILFGAAATDRFDPQRHTVRNVLVLEAIDLQALRRLAEHGTKLGKDRISAPLVMTPQYIRASLDSFPLEMIEIYQEHFVLFGRDHFADLAFEDQHIRLQCERDIKSMLIRLRQDLLAAAGRENVLEAIELDMAEGVVRTMRGLLWLTGQTEGMPAASAVTAVEGLIGRKLDGVRTALDVSAEHGWLAFERLYQDIEALGAYADAL